MNEMQLEHFRTLAAGLEKRQRTAVRIYLSNGNVLEALFDPMFRTVTIGGSTFPEGEMATWIKLLFNSKIVKIGKNN